MINRTTIASLAIFSSLVLLIGFMANTFQYAEAVTTNVDFTFQSSNNEIFYMSATGLYVVMAKVTNGTSTKVYTIPAGTTEPENYISTNFSISPQFGGCTHATDTFNSNPCSTVASANCNPNTFGEECVSANKYGSFGGLWCGLTDCFTVFNAQDGTYSNQLIRFAIEGDSAREVTGVMNFTDNDFLPMLTGVDIGSVGIGGISVFALACAGACSTSEVPTLYKIGGTSLMGSVGSVTSNQIGIGDSTSSLGWGITNLDICWFCGGDTNTKIIFIAGKQASNTNRAITLVNAETMTERCGATNSGLATGSSQNTGHIRYLGNTKNQFAYVTDTNLVSLNLSCAKQVTTAYATLGISNYPQSIAIDNTEQTMYILHGSSASVSSIKKANLTSFNTALDFDSLVGSSISGWVVGGNMFDSLAYSPVSHTILYSGSDAKARFLYLDNFTGGEGNPNDNGAGGEICFVVEGTGQQICYPTDENGNPIVGSAIETVTNQNPPALAVGKFLCQLGVIEDCTDGAPTNTNTEENGVGYILFIAILALIMAVVGAGLYGKIKIEYNLMLQVVVLLISSGLAMALNWIPDMIFYAIIFVIIGFASLAGASFISGHTKGRGSS